MTTTPGVRYIGTTDDVTTCDHCGKADLASTVVLELLDEAGNGDGIAYYGTTCAARALAPRGIRTTAAKVRDAARFAGERTIREAEYAAERIALYSGPDAVELFRRNNPSVTGLRTMEWARTALAECMTLWEQQVADARRIGWAA